MSFLNHFPMSKRSHTLFLPFIITALLLNCVKAYSQVSASNLFVADSIMVSGQIRNFDPQSGTASLSLQISDHPVNRVVPRMVRVDSTGRFARKIYLPHAQTATIEVGNGIWFRVYLESGNDLIMEFDMDDIVNAGYGNDQYRFASKVDFGGTLGQINKELAGVPEIKHRVAVFSMTCDPDEAKKQISDCYDEWKKAIDDYAATLPESSRAIAIMKNNVTAHKAVDLLDYADMNENHAPVTDDFYYDFLGEVMDADTLMLLSDCAPILINRLGFCHLLPKYKMALDCIALRDAIKELADHGVSLSDEGAAMIDRVVPSDAELNTIGYHDGFMVINYIYEAAKNGGILDEFIEKFDNRPLTASKMKTDADVIRKICGRESNLPLLWQIAMGGVISDDYTYMDLINEGITDPYVLGRMAAMKVSTMNNSAKELPSTEGGRLMSEIIAPYRGKYLLVDFWDIYCGPCRYGIESNKEMRDKHRGNPEFAILFIASENGSPQSKYDKYVAEHLQGENLLRLNTMQMAMLQELFGFLAIPRYILFDKQGRVVDSNSAPYNFWQFLAEQSIIDLDY